MIDVGGFLGEVTQSAHHPVIWSFIFGGIAGLGCTQCVLPLVFYGAAEGSTKKGFIFALLFNLPRLLMFLLLGVIAAASTHIVQLMSSPSPTLLGFMWLLTGLVLILFSAELFGIMNLDKVIAARLMDRLVFLLGKDFSTHYLGAVVRGFIFSFACVLGSSLIIFGVWGMAVLSSGPLIAFLAVFAFGVGNIMFSSVAATVMGASTGFLERKTRKNIPRYVSLAGSIVILFIGLTYLAEGLRILMML